MNQHPHSHANTLICDTSKTFSPRNLDVGNIFSLVFMLSQHTEKERKRGVLQKWPTDKCEIVKVQKPLIPWKSGGGMQHSRTF